MTFSKKRSIGDSIFLLINGLLISVLTLFFLYPLWHVIMASFSEPSSLMAHTGLLLKPTGFSLEGYKTVLARKSIWVGYGNTLFYVIVGTAINVIMTSLGAYVLSRRDLKLKKVMSLLIVISMYINGGMIPNFLVVRYLGLYDTRWALILPGVIGTWNMIVLRTSFNQIPHELEESAMIDGANDAVVLFRIIFPVAKATIMVIALFYAVSHWNAWFSASIYLQDRGKWPLALYLREILLQNVMSSMDADVNEIGGTFNLDELIKYCTIVVTTLPILCVYPFVQKYFVKGIMLGAVKA